ncbi:MAG: DUF983 domain-containing protein [Planctomycetes bacterium]|nr:DUF983 domain-containing protein [Planctomycetota bacterium]
MHEIEMLVRGLLRRCPNCGELHIFRRWLTMVDRCPRCGLHFEREEGHWTGAIAINLVATELVFVALLLIVIIRTWPDIPSTQLLIAGALLNLTFPLIFYPFAKTLWVAIDLIAHPLEPKERLEMASLQHVRERESLQ